MHYLLGAPGSGKTALTEPLRRLLPGWAVLDWDGLMAPASRLAGRAIRDDETLWEPYAGLVKAVIDQLDSRRVALLTVCTPDQLTGWPAGPWLLLDCTDAERTRRLHQRGETARTIRDALADAKAYRQLHLPLLDTTTRTPLDLAQDLAHRLAPH